jgi:NAD(P)-dependent dehydrogenase (short-subunit alcohol dehydrogenase family)
MRIDGVSALVTGGASGLGAATVRMLCSRGATCTILDRDADRAGALALELGAGTAAAAGDVADPEAVGAAIERARASGPLRIVISCAGIGWAQRTVARDGAAHELSAFEQVIRVNLTGTFNVLRLGAAAMSANDPLDGGERGVVVNTSSVAAFEGQIGQIAYSASKGGIAAMTVPAARDLAAVGIRVNAIAPGLMDTPLLAQLPPAVRNDLGATVPFPKRLGDPAEYAALVASIVENPYLNGATIRLDGALRMPPK